MISFFKNRKFNKLLSNHPNFGFKPNASIYNEGLKIGILGNASDKKVIEQFAEHLKSRSTAISVLFFHNVKEDVVDGYSLKNVVWSGISVSENIEDFLAKEYDRFFFLSTTMSSHQYYIYRLCKTRFSIGPLLNENEVPFDLSIELKELNINLLISEIKRGMALLSHLS